MRKILACLTLSTILSGVPVSAQENAVAEQFVRLKAVLGEIKASPQIIDFCTLAAEKFAQEDIDGALTELEKAMELEARRPTFRAIWVPYAQIVQDRKRYERGIQFLQRLVLDNPKAADVHAGLGFAISHLQVTNDKSRVSKPGSNEPTVGCPYRRRDGLRGGLRVMGR